MNFWRAAYVILFCCFAQLSIAQLTTSTLLTPAQLVQNVLLGSGVTATNITYTGATQAIGSFNGTNSNIGFANGVLLTSGIPSNATGPNNITNVSTTNSVSGDADLNIIMAPTLSYDASILEFDFVATSDTMKFRYVFGSDEYMEYVSLMPGGINDGFGLFISGPGISGPFSNNAKNIAIIPNTSLPVTMFNLNLYSNGQYYVDNGNNGVNVTPGGPTVQYDGFTKPLTAIAALQCGEKYHIKIAIADGGDYIIDSGVFLEAGSFVVSNSLAINSSSTFNGHPGSVDTVMYEGCGSIQIDLTRSGCNLPNADTIQIGYLGTAINGIDYLAQSNIIFAPGVANGSFVISSLSDAIVEGNETIILTFGTNTLTLIIIDSPPLIVDLQKDTAIYCNQSIMTLTASVTGGVPVGVYTYNWTNTTGSLTSATIHPTVTTTYYLTVSDTCGNTATDSTTVAVYPYVPMILTLNNDTTICEGKSVFLDANVINGVPGFIYSWNPSVSTKDTITLWPNVTTEYIFNVTDACGNSIKDTVSVTVIPNNANYTYTFITNQIVNFTNLSTGNSNYYWDFGDNSPDSTSTSKNPAHNYLEPGTYRVMLISSTSSGCTDTAYQVLVIYPDLHFYFPNAFSPNGDGLNDIYSGKGVGLKSYRMQIYNRWGERFFESTNVVDGWDGTYNGENAEQGVYVVRFDISGFNKEGLEKTYFGHITLLR